MDRLSYVFRNEGMRGEACVGNSFNHSLQDHWNISVTMWSQDSCFICLSLRLSVEESKSSRHRPIFSTVSSAHFYQGGSPDSGGNPMRILEHVEDDHASCVVRSLIPGLGTHETLDSVPSSYLYSSLLSWEGCCCPGVVCHKNWVLPSLRQSRWKQDKDSADSYPKRVCSTGSCRMSTEPSFILESFWWEKTYFRQ